MRYAAKTIMAVLILASLSLYLSSSALALENAYRYRTVNNYGARNSIVTGNPTLRNDSTGKWSYMRVASQYISGTDVYYVEIGWMKGAQPESNGVPRMYHAFRDTTGYSSHLWGGYPGIGLAYNYQVKRTGNNTWSMYFNDLNSFVSMRNVGWNTATRVFSGGETPNTNQGMGASDNNNNAYLSTTGTWYQMCNTTDRVTDAIYTITGTPNCYSWSVSGNN